MYFWTPFVGFVYTKIYKDWAIQKSIPPPIFYIFLDYSSRAMRTLRPYDPFGWYSPMTLPGMDEIGLWQSYSRPSARTYFLWSMAGLP